MPRASRPDIDFGIIDEHFAAEILAHLALPVEQFHAFRSPILKGFENLLGNALDAPEMEGEQSASSLFEVIPKPVEQTVRSEGDDIVALTVLVALDVIPEQRGPRILVDYEIEVPSDGFELRDVVHHYEISHFADP